MARDARPPSGGEAGSSDDDAAGVGRKLRTHWRAIAAASLCHFSVVLGAALSTSLPPSVVRNAVDEAEGEFFQSLMAFSFYLGSALSAYPWGAVVDARGRRLPMMIGLGILSTTQIFFAFAENLFVFIGLRFIQGLIDVRVATRVIIADVSDDASHPVAMTIWSVAWFVGGAIGFFAGVFLVDKEYLEYLGVHYAVTLDERVYFPLLFLSAAILTAACALFVYFVFAESKDICRGTPGELSPGGCRYSILRPDGDGFIVVEKVEDLNDDDDDAAKRTPLLADPRPTIERLEGVSPVTTAPVFNLVLLVVAAFFLTLLSHEAQVRRAFYRSSASGLAMTNREVAFLEIAVKLVLSALLLVSVTSLSAFRQSRIVGWSAYGTSAIAILCLSLFVALRQATGHLDAERVLFCIQFTLVHFFEFQIARGFAVLLNNSCPSTHWGRVNGVAAMGRGAVAAVTPLVFSVVLTPSHFRWTYAAATGVVGAAYLAVGFGSSSLTESINTFFD